MNVTIINNQIVGPLYSPYAAVNLANIDDVTVVNNIVYQANPATTVLLQTSSVVNPQGNITAGVYFNQTPDVPVLPNWPGLVDVSISTSIPAKPNTIASSANYVKRFFFPLYLWLVIDSLLWVSGAFAYRH
jgi:hypothetical protein